MSYPITNPFWQFVDQWQTLITGVCALVAGVGTVWATRDAANREIAAAHEQTKAAQEQTKVAQQQIEATARIERRRIARESYAFYATVEAAMAAVIADVGEAWTRAGAASLSGARSPTAAEIRASIRKPAFDELREAVLRLGGQLTSSFLALDLEIDEFASKVTVIQGMGAQGEHGGLQEDLNRIGGQAKSLRSEAVTGMERCLKLLGEEQGPGIA